MSGNKERSFPCLVAKFGGSSLANGTDILRGVRSVINEKRRGTQIAVVVSAMGKTTDRLISIAEKACGREVSPNELDDIVAMGERTTARIFTAALRSKGERSICLDPSDADWPIITDDSFNNAKPILLMCERRIKEKIQPMLEKGITVVIPGFVGRTEEELITTMGRGGSDITAMILARGLSADQVTLVTDVDGIMSADPKIIKNPKRLDNMEIDTLVGLADSGSKFVHKKALRYKSPTIDVKVINNAAGDLRAEGTTILGSFPETIAVESHPDVSMAVTIVGKAISESPETLQNLLQEVRKFSVPILGMSINHNSLIFYLPVNCSDELLEALHSIVTKDDRTLAMAVRQNLSFINVKGVGLEETPGIIKAISDVLTVAHINIYGIFTITSSVTLFVDLKDKERAIQLMGDSVGRYTGENVPPAKEEEE